MASQREQQQSYSERPDLDVPDFEERCEFVLERIDNNIDKYRTSFPSSATGPEMDYDEWDVTDWTPSFWTGMLWLAYEHTGDEKYREVAEGHLDAYEDRLENTEHIMEGTLTHDIGFLYSLSAVAQYRLTGNERARQVGLFATDRLVDRFHDAPGIIQAWGDHRDPDDVEYGSTIVDSIMNLPLLYWASEETGYDRYRTIADIHAEQLAEHFVRDDYSTYHVYKFDVETGEPIRHRAERGANYDSESCWARGQAWAVYGFPLAYRYSGNEAFREMGRNVTEYYLNNLPEDHVPRWDFGAPEDHIRDSSSAAIAASGLIELASCLPAGDPDRQRYLNASLAMLDSLGQNYTTKGADSEALLREAKYANDPDDPNNAAIFGDYYYYEALTRVTRDWESYW
ncbi:glycoside hydrolase family 88 protein [Halocatena marina]|uniref:Glycoside hydrolase family 88 protein n=2 Tax=Halocatena marina TaxID=2934937 RepID=A0ABD5YYK2_9EURY|nr:glycoside hydrolase family 88 protein [Halocatena marina]